MGNSVATMMVSLIVLAAALLVRWLLDPLLGEFITFVAAFGAIAFSVWLGGYRMAVVVAALGYIACSYLFVDPRGSLSFDDPRNLVGLAAFVLTSAVIIGFGEAMRRAQIRAREQRELLRITLSSIGDAVITTDLKGRVTYLNEIAEKLTGWPSRSAAGRPLDDIFNIVNEHTRERAPNPAERALREGAIVGLANHTVLVARNGAELPIDDSAAPILNESGAIVGCVLVFRDVSERRRTEAALIRSEKELSDFFDSASIGLHWVGPGGVIQRANVCELQMLGYDRGEYVGHHISEFHVDEPVIDDMLERLTAGETLYDYPARMRCKDGSVIDVLVDSSGLFEDGRFIHTRCFTRDVTLQKRAEEIQALLASIVNNSDDAIISKTLEGVISSWNAGAERLFGYTAEEMIGKPINIIIPPERQDEEQMILERLARGEKVDHFETIRVARDGRRLDISLTVSPVRDKSGRITGASKVSRDITDRKRAAAARREGEQRFRIMADAAPVMIWIRDPGLQGTWFSQKWLEFTGRTLEEEIGAGWEGGIHPDDVDQSMLVYRSAFQERGPFTMEYRLRRHDGEYRWLLDIGTPLTSGGGEFTGFIGSCVDITDLKHAEASLRQADRRKDEFLATLAHELRNPLAPVRNSLEIMKQPGMDRARLEQARGIMDRQIGQMERLIEDLLDISRITRNRLELRKQQVELASVMHHVVEASRPLAEDHGHRIELKLPDEAVYIHGDPVRLAQVFGNLLNNACKYTPRAGRISFRAARHGDEVSVSVKDNGMGIPADMLPRVFDIFVQKDWTLEQSQGGLGIGLSLVRQLVDMHGGRVEARSEGPDRGSEFIVTLPVSATEPPGEEFPPPGAAKPAPAQRRILVVDDKRDNAESLATLLEIAGYETRLACDGLTGIELAGEFRPQVILLDLGMPGLDGFETCRRIRAETWGADLIIVALTGWGQEEDRRRTREAGFDGHLVKPVSLAALTDLMSSLAPDHPGQAHDN